MWRIHAKIFSVGFVRELFTKLIPLLFDDESAGAPGATPGGHLCGPKIAIAVTYTDLNVALKTG